ncbi:MAG: kinase [Proteobacteria bacterium]|nr:kinase [Pseudomonadota bacterium]
MIISRTPFRVSFFGGGTDYPGWYREHGGAVLATTINRYCYITCRFLPPFFEHRSRIVWSRIELVKERSEIAHPAARATLEYLGIDQGVEIHHDGDLPARSGLGSSSAFTVGLLNALHRLKGERLDKAALAREAIHVELDLLKEGVGVQDQIATAHGGLNRIDIAPDGAFAVRPLAVANARVEELQRHLLLFYTGVPRSASEIAQAQVAAIPQRQSELTAMRRLVDEAAALLAATTEIGEFGRLLDETWRLKRSLSARIAPAFVDDIYARARGAGALGGKLLGAGGGGFMLIFARPDDHQRVLTALADLLVVPIAFDDRGSEIIFEDTPRYSRTVLKGQRYRRYDTNGGKAR